MKVRPPTVHWFFSPSYAALLILFRGYAKYATRAELGKRMYVQTRVAEQ